MEFDCIPPEIWTQILSYLPVKSLLRFRSVSKQWKSLIGHCDFASLHLNRYSENRLETRLIVLEKDDVLSAEEHRARWFSRCATTQNYEQISELDFRAYAEPLILGSSLFIAGAVNGLLLVKRKRGKSWSSNNYIWESSVLKKLKRLSEGDVFLWNLSIRKCVNIHLPSFSPHSWVGDLCLGFDPTTNDYKVVRMIPHDCDGSSFTIEIFSLKARTWKKRSYSEGTVFLMGDDNKVYLRGSVHWVGYDKDFSMKAFVSFNMICDTYSHIPLPNVSHNPVEGATMQPLVVAGSLVGIVTTCNDINEIWVLGQDECWSKRFKVNARIDYVHEDRLFLNKDGLLIWESFEEGIDLSLCAYDINTGKKSIVSYCGKWWPFYIGAFIESLVLLS